MRWDNLTKQAAAGNSLFATVCFWVILYWSVLIGYFIPV